MLNTRTAGKVAFVIVCVIAVVATYEALQSQRRERQLVALLQKETGTPPFTSTVEWFNPPSVKGGSDGVAIPSGFFFAVDQSHLQKAISMLDKTECVALLDGQVSDFVTDANWQAAIASLIQLNTKKLEDFQSPDWLKGLRGGELTRAKIRQQSRVASFSKKLKLLEDLQSSVKPYLVRAVSVPKRGDFGGFLSAGDLEVFFYIWGRGSYPMRKQPVVVFLPYAPRHVYTSVLRVE